MNTNTTSRHSISGALACAVLAALVGGLSGCRGDREEKPPRQFFPDMDDMPKWKPQAQSEFFPDGRTMRQPAKNTVAFSRVPLDAATIEQKPEWSKPFLAQRTDLLKDGEAFFQGKNADGSFVDVMPVDVTKEMLLHGRVKFDIYCAVCHGYSGDGLGIIGDTDPLKDRAFVWSAPIPSYHAEKYRMVDPADATSQKHKDGFLFDVARNGVIDATGAQKMPPYKHALDEHDSWAVVAYIRALQRSHLGTAGDLPEATRQAVDAAAANQTATPAGGKP